jgi:hypothetical protein
MPNFVIRPQTDFCAVIVFGDLERTATVGKLYSKEFNAALFHVFGKSSV